jgi:hypothetical protein
VIFLNPWLFWGLAATVAVPIVLHLIMRQSPKHVVFPALQFLRQRKEANRRRLRFRHLLLLALRVLTLLFLAAALCRPSVGCSGIRRNREAPVSAAVVIDTSPSMLYEQQNQTRLQAAQETAAWLLEKLPEESQIAVFDSANDATAFEVDLPQAREHIGQLQPTMKPDRLLSIAGRAIALLKSGKHEGKELYLFSDLSRYEWSAENAGPLVDRLNELRNLGVYVIDVGAQRPQNTALGELRLSSETVARNGTVNLEQVVTRIGDSFRSPIEYTLRDETGDIVRQERKAEVSLRGDDSQTLSLPLGGMTKPGTYQGIVRIINSENNLLTIDDAKYFTIDVRPPWPILLVAPQPSEAYAWDLRQALEPARHRAEDRQRFACEIQDQDDLADLETKKLASFKAVALLDPQPLGKPLWDKLAAYVAQGGSLVVFLGRNVERGKESFNDGPAQALLPGQLLGKADFGDDVYLDPAPYQHDMLAYFRSEPQPWDEFWVRNAWQVDEKQFHQGVQVVARYKNGVPAILLRKVGEGRVVTMTTPVSDELDESAWNILPKQSGRSLIPPRPFIALANEMMLYLVGAGEQRLNYLPGEAARLALQPGQVVERFKLTPPSGEQDAAFRDADPNEPAIVITSLNQVGHWRVERKETEPVLSRGFSVNLAPEESNLARAEENDLKGIFGETPFSLARNREEINRKLTETRVGHELFPLLIALVALVLGAEHVLANRFYRHEEEEG